MKEWLHALRPAYREVTEEQCRHCHADVVDAMGTGELSCIRCHDSVGHRVRE